MPDWIKDDGSFADDWLDKAGIPAEQRDYAKGIKDVVTLVKRGADTQKEFHTRVKLPADEAGKREFLAQHFKDVLDADDRQRKQAAEAAQQQAAEKAKTAAQQRLEQSAKALKEHWGEKYDQHLELARRAFRHEQCPAWIKAAVASAVGVEAEKLTDEQIKQVVARDPAVAETLRIIGELTSDGHLDSGDGGGLDTSKDEQVPLQPSCPELYEGLPDNDPTKRWFLRRGYEFQNGRYIGRRNA